MEKFIRTIEQNYTPKIEKINEKIDDIFKDKNKICLRNIKNIFYIINTNEFQNFLSEYGTRLIIDSESLFMKETNYKEILEKMMDKYKNIPLAQYYYKISSIDNLVDYIVIDYNSVIINDKTFSSIDDLYESEYRFLFYKFSYTEFKNFIERKMVQINVIEN